MLDIIKIILMAIAWIQYDKQTKSDLKLYWFFVTAYWFTNYIQGI